MDMEGKNIFLKKENKIEKVTMIKLWHSVLQGAWKEIISQLDCYNWIPKAG